jgi:cytochrome c oxidase subunit 2
MKPRIWVIAMAAALLGIGAVLVPLAGPYLRAASEPDLRIRAVAHQWWWEFDYPSLGIKTSDVLYLPSTKNIRLELSSGDVIHSFWILGMKDSVSLVPGRPRSIDLLLKSSGELYGNCDSGCGCGTVCMRFRVLARTPEQFQQWAANERARPTEFRPPQLAAAPPCATDPSRDHRATGKSRNTNLQRLLDGG